jgi:co-chaperonin GroES (HSP10)
VRVKPLRDNVLVEVVETLTKKETKTELSDEGRTVEKEVDVPVRVKARVLAVGPGDFRDGVFVPVDLVESDVVLLCPNRYGDAVVEPGTNATPRTFIVDEGDVIAVVLEE